MEVTLNCEGPLANPEVTQLPLNLEENLVDNRDESLALISIPPAKLTPVVDGPETSVGPAEGPPNPSILVEATTGQGQNSNYLKEGSETQVDFLSLVIPTALAARVRCIDGLNSMHLHRAPKIGKATSTETTPSGLNAGPSRKSK